MRAKIYEGNLRIDLLHTPEEIADVVHLVTAAGLINLRISPDGEGPSMAVDVAIPNGWVTHVGAADGATAVRLAEAVRPRVILMDIQLPVMSGLDAAQEIKSREDLREIPIVALTARAMKGDRERILDAGCDDYLSKPIEPERLQSTVQRWLDETALPGSAQGGLS